MVPADAGVWRSVVDLNGRVTQHLNRLLATKPKFVDRLEVRINPSIRWDRAKLWLLSHGPREPLCSVMASAAVQEFLKCVRVIPSCHRRSECASTCVGRMTRRESSSVDFSPWDCLEPVMPVADQVVDPLRQLSTLSRKSWPLAPMPKTASRRPHHATTLR
jgi:hypothetical protein